MHVVTRICAILLAALLLFALTQGTDPAAAKKKFKTITKTFSNNGQIDIPGTGTSGPANPYPVTIEVAGFKKGKILDVNLVLLELSHTRPDNVDVLLAAPGDRDALVMSDVGGDDLFSVLDVTLTLDDEAALDLPIGSQLSGGSFKPTNNSAGDGMPAPAPEPSGAVALSTFDGGNPNGQWELYVADDLGNFSGSLDGGWTLQITAKVKKKK